MRLTYFGIWDNIQPQIDPQLAEELYVAPGIHSVISMMILLVIYLELHGTGKPVPSVDWWSIGAILYETLTGLVSISIGSV